MCYYLFIILLLTSLCNSQKAINDEGDIISTDSKYRSKDPVDAQNVLFGKDASAYLKGSECHQDIDILWKTTLGAPITTVPLIADLFSDGSKEIVFTTSNSYVEVLDAHGHKAEGWPFAFPSVSFQSNPLLYDINNDGVNEIVVTTQNGEIVFLGQNGMPEYGKTLKVPRLRVRKDWFDGLVDDNVVATFSLNKKQEEDDLINSESTKGSGRKVLSVEDNNNYQKEAKAEDTFAGFGGWLTDEGIESLELFLSTDTPSSLVGHVKLQKDPLYSKQYEELINKTKRSDHKHVLIDAHVLSTPVITDLEKDGNMELVVAVSYFFDSTQYSDPEEMKHIDVDVDLTKYVAGGLVVFDLQKQKIKFTVDFDLTTGGTTYAGYIYAQPTVVDLTGDGKLEIIIGTAVGYVYVVDADGNIKKGLFPLMMDSIYSSVIAEDVNGDGALELIACDINSNIVCFNTEGEELWEQRISGYPNQPPSVGDINGDGVLDLVVGTTEGHIWAVRGDNGHVLPHFPIKLRGRVYGQPLLVQLDNTKSSLNIVIAAQDGFVYIIDGQSGCFDKIDIGESSFSMILADDISGNGKLDLLVTTRGGTIYLIGTNALYHPLKAWTSADQGGNGLTVRNGHQGIFISDSNKHLLRDVYGDSFRVQFDIVDNRKSHKIPAQYDVKLTYGTFVLFQKTYSGPGSYVETIISPTERIAVTVQIEMTNEFGQRFYDDVAISFNMHFYRVLKWVLVLPFAVMSIVLLLIKELSSPLPLSV